MTKKRQTKSKEYIYQAISLLLAEKSWDQISISQICHKAGINRGTFYLHYTDKEDLMETIRQEKVQQLSQLLEQDFPTNQDLLAAMLETIKNDQDFLKNYLKQERLGFQAGFRLVLEQILNKIPEIDQVLANHYGVPAIYARSVYSASVQELITLWIENDFPESSQELSQLMLKLGNLQEIVL